MPTKKEIGKNLYAHFERKIIPFIDNWDDIKRAVHRDSILAKLFSTTPQGIRKWRVDGIPMKNNKSMTDAIDKFFIATLLSSIKPLIEFQRVFPGVKQFKKGSVKHFRHTLYLDPKKEIELEDKYNLDAKSGVYIFYSSTGNIFYIGKSYNLKIEISQQINHKLTNTSTDLFLSGLKTADDLKMKKGDALCYLSIYLTHPDFVNNVEAFLIRSSMNENLNKKRENFKFHIVAKKK